MLFNQSIDKKHIRFIWLILGLIGVILLIELLDFVLRPMSAIIRTFGSLSIVALAVVYCYRLIYYRLAEYHYKVIGEQVVLEKVMGRANHVTFHFNQSDILYFAPYKNEKITSRNIFTNSRFKQKWYLIHFMQNGRRKSVVIEPNPQFIQILSAYSNETPRRQIS